MCPGPPLCTSFHSQIHIAGPEIIAATNPGLRDLDPDALLRFGTTNWHVWVDGECHRAVVTMWFPGEREGGGGPYTVALPLHPELDHDEQADSLITMLTASDPRGRLPRDLPTS